MDFQVDSEAEEYAVEKIVKRRIMSNGKVAYFLKWKNWSEDYNSWEPEEHLHCPELIEKFLKEEREREATLSSVKNADANNNEQRMDTPAAKREENCAVAKVRLFKIPDVSGFDRGLQAERIVGATDNDGLTFLIKFKGQDKMELVPSKIARYKCPSLVISFFEKHITWHSACDRIKKC